MPKDLMPNLHEVEIREEVIFSDRVYNFLQRIAFLRLSDERKSALSLQIVDDSKGDKLYWIQIFLSTIIATFGLLQNSVAVIIGAMLVAPLLKPIKGLAFAIASGHASRFWRSMKLLTWSVALAVGLSFLFSMMIPLKIETSEIVARTVPNLLDLFIAVASGIIALLALSFERLSESVAGVAMSSALLPPLAVIGIELSLGHYSSSFGSFVLFITNILAILMVGTVIFILYGFAPHQEQTQKRTFENLIILIGLIVIISIPLFSSLLKIADRITIQQKAQVFLETTIEDFYAQANISKLEILSFDEEKVHLLGVIQLPEGTQFFQETRSAIRDQLGDVLGRDVKFDVEILRTATIQSLEETKKKAVVPLADQLKKEMRNIIETTHKEAIVLNIEISSISVPMVGGVTALAKKESDEAQNQQKWTIKNILSLPTGTALSDKSKQEMELQLQNLFGDKKLSFFWISISQAEPPVVEEEPSEREKFYEDVHLKWEDFLKEVLPQGANFENLKITWDLNGGSDSKFDSTTIEKFTVKFDLFLSGNATEWLPELRAKMQNFSTDAFDKPADIEIRTFNYSLEKISSDTSNEITETEPSQNENEPIEEE